MSKIVSIGTAVPQFQHQQKDILPFMQRVYAMSESDKRKMRFLYNQSAIDIRYSVVPDYSVPIDEWSFYPATENLDPFPRLEKRMKWFHEFAPPLSADAIENCLEAKDNKSITHLITVSCTGMSAPGLDLQVVEALDLPSTIYRTSVNFMGCYAAIHALKMADAICKSDLHARVMMVCTELCTLHFQRENNIDNIATSLLFGDGSAAALVTHDNAAEPGVHLKSFYSEVSTRGKKDMSWELSSSGFLMTLSGYVPDLIEHDFRPLLTNALAYAGLSRNDIKEWCIHPGGRKILEAISKSIEVSQNDLSHSYSVLKNFGNMSSPTILFVLKEILAQMEQETRSGYIFGAAFGPGLTMETMLLHYD